MGTKTVCVIVINRHGVLLVMVMDSTVESTADVTPIAPSQDGVVKKKKKKRKHSTAMKMKELPPLRLPPTTTSLELHQLSGVCTVTVCSTSVCVARAECVPLLRLICRCAC